MFLGFDGSYQRGTDLQLGFILVQIPHCSVVGLEMCPLFIGEQTSEAYHPHHLLYFYLKGHNFSCLFIANTQMYTCHQCYKGSVSLAGAERRPGREQGAVQSDAGGGAPIAEGGLQRGRRGQQEAGGTLENPAKEAEARKREHGEEQEVEEQVREEKTEIYLKSFSIF